MFAVRRCAGVFVGYHQICMCTYLRVRFVRTIRIYNTVKPNEATYTPKSGLAKNVSICVNTEG